MRILIGILSKSDDPARRKRCRETWLRDLENYPGVAAKFVIGSDVSNAVAIDDVLLVPCDDGYNELPQKTTQLAKWAVKFQDFEFLFKCDDDTYVDIPRLLKAIPTSDYTGCDIGRYASGGAGYWLSRKATMVIARDMRHRTGAEDVLVGQTLSAVDIRVKHDDRYAGWLQDHLIPAPSNDRVAVHAIRDDRMYAIYDRMRGSWQGLLRIVMPTSNRYTKVARASLELLQTNWPKHPPIDVVFSDDRVASRIPDRQLSCGRQDETGWVESMIRYLQWSTADQLILVLDDYATCGPVNEAAIALASEVLQQDASVSCIYLTWHACTNQRDYPGCSKLKIHPAWDYSFNLQAAIWRREHLLKQLQVLPPKVSIWEAETRGSHIYNHSWAAKEHHLGFDLKNAGPHSLMLDQTDKADWVIPYHNLMHQCYLDMRHYKFLTDNGIDPNRLQ